MNIKRFENKVAIVTGASRGIGQGIALAFAREGAHVVSVDIGDQTETGQKAQALGAKFNAYTEDFGKLTQKGAAELVAKIIADCGRVDILVNNAGIGRYAPGGELPEASFREQFDTNVVAPFLFTKAAVPQMKKQRSGQIVNIGSVVGYLGTARGTAYVATKWALRGMNECWREELYPHGIKVAYVAPGFVISEFNGRKEDPETPEAEWALTPDDVARAVENVVDQGPNSDIREIVMQVRDRS